jgi:hypothetical protein
LELPRGGTIAGHVVLDGPGSAYGWTAYASDSLAEVAHAEAAEDGSFRFENLHSGPWQVRVFEPGRRFYPGGRMRTERVPEPDVQVVAGSIAEYEHRSQRIDRARLRGRLAIDGAAPGPLLVVVATSTPQAAFTTTRSALDPDGCFEVELQPGLKTGLTILGRYRGTQLSIITSLEIAPGENDWSFEFATARLEGHVDPTGLSASRPSRPTYIAERGAVTVRVTVEPDEHGHYGPYVVPAGRGRLEGPSMNEFVAPAPIWGEFDLAPGELRVEGHRPATSPR